MPPDHHQGPEPAGGASDPISVVLTNPTTRRRHPPRTLCWAIYILHEPGCGPSVFAGPRFDRPRPSGKAARRLPEGQYLKSTAWWDMVVHIAMNLRATLSRLVAVLTKAPGVGTDAPQLVAWRAGVDAVKLAFCPSLPPPGAGGEGREGARHRRWGRHDKVEDWGCCGRELHRRHECRRDPESTESRDQGGCAVHGRRADRRGKPIVAKRLGDVWVTPIIIENRPGPPA